MACSEKLVGRLERLLTHSLAKTLERPRDACRQATAQSPHSRTARAVSVIGPSCSGGGQREAARNACRPAAHDGAACERP